MVKDQEFLEKKALYCLGLAKKLGATQSSVVVNNSVSETVNFRNKKLDESNRSDDLGINITTYIGKKKSSISCLLYTSPSPRDKRQTRMPSSA